MGKLKDKQRAVNVKKSLRTVAPADPTLWREKDQGSVPASWTTQYTDIAFQCSCCRKECVFSADDQKYTYETKKAPIDQRRHLCEACWKQSHEFAAGIKLHQEQWAASKTTLTSDAAFLNEWLELLKSSEKFYIKQDMAAKAMLQKLISKIRD